MAIPPLDERTEDADDYVVVPPDGGWGWLIVAAAFYCQLVIDGIQLSYGMILKEIADGYGVPYSSVSLIGSIMYGMHYLAGPICAGLSYSFGDRPVTILGSILSCVGLSSAYFRPPVFVLYITVGLLSGVGLCFVNMNSIIITTLYFSQRRILALGIVVCGTGAGTMVFAAMAHVVLKSMNWEAVCLLEGLLSLSMAVAAISFRPLKPTHIQTETSVQSVEVRDEDIDDTVDEEPRATRVFYIRNSDVLTQSLSRSTSISSFVEHTGQALEDLATTVTHTQINRGHPHCQKLSRWCCPSLAHQRRHRKVLAMNPALKKSVLLEDSENGVKRMSIENQENRSRSSNFRALCLRILSAMLDCHILKSGKVIIFCVAVALSASALIIVVFYVKVRALSQDETENDAMWLIIVIGGANMFWRLVLGTVSAIPRVNYHALNITGLLLGGFATILSGIHSSSFYQYFCGAIFGLAIACFAVFYPVILMELVGADSISNATGIAMLFMGVFSIVGAPLSGAVMEVTGNQDSAFYIAGAMFVTSGILFVLLNGKRLKISQRM